MWISENLASDEFIFLSLLLSNNDIASNDELALVPENSKYSENTWSFTLNSPPDEIIEAKSSCALSKINNPVLELGIKTVSLVPS